MDVIGRLADLSVKRGVGFALLAIVMVMAGLAAFPALAFRTGAALMLLTWAALKIKALQAPHRPYKRTELWMMLEPRPALSPPRAQEIVGGALRAAFERHASYALLAAIALWACGLALSLLGFD
jgi:hypothetical protein